MQRQLYSSEDGSGSYTAPKTQLRKSSCSTAGPLQAGSGRRDPPRQRLPAWPGRAPSSDPWGRAARSTGSSFHLRNASAGHLAGAAGGGPRGGFDEHAHARRGGVRFRGSCGCAEPSAKECCCRLADGGKAWLGSYCGAGVARELSCRGGRCARVARALQRASSCTSASERWGACRHGRRRTKQHATDFKRIDRLLHKPAPQHAEP
jgi:hypothetical protein